MPRIATIVLAIVVPIAALAIPGRARACSYAEAGVFEHAEQAEIVAVGRWTGRELRVERTILGPRRGTLARQPARPVCGVEVRRGRRVLVLADARGAALSVGTSVIELSGAEGDAMVRALEAWRDGDDRGRLEVLVRAATDPATPALARAAARLLAQAHWLGRIDDGSAARLVAALALGDARTDPLALVLARLRRRDAIAPLIACSRRGDHALGCAEALRILTNRSGPELTFQDRLAGLPEDGVVSAWERWLAALPADADLVALGWAERSIPDPGHDLGALAERIRSGPGRIDRVVALDLCERALGRALIDFTRAPWLADAALIATADRCHE